MICAGLENMHAAGEKKFPRSLAGTGSVQVSTGFFFRLRLRLRERLRFCVDLVA
jgi:hypothetical protein